VLRDVLVLNFNSVLDQHSLQYFSRVAATCDGRSTAESLENGLVNFARLFINLDLQLHDVAARWRTYQSSTYVRVLFVQRSYVSWVFIVVQDIFVVSKQPNRLLDQ
jgi:hypothetical protein